MSGFVIKSEERKSDNKYPKPDPGTHIARCVQMIDLGTYEDTRWDDSYPKREILLGFEFPAMDQGEHGPVMLWKRFTFSLNEKAALRKELKKWRGRDYTAEELAAGVDVSSVVGQPCQVSVEEWSNSQTGKSGVSISGLAKPMEGLDCPPQINKSIIWLIEDWDQETFDTFATHMQERILASDEAKARTASDPSDAADIPF